ncbi:Coq4 family protein [Sphingomonas fennica]|uniref:Ubiquinone biosynthesis protein n=1 Tax=Edaphosphingomonas fennica TaxID=114404 RepID=A0A2T4HMU3_9SPHN|nr:Coq4 family protein [Sphingomonas fennica]PTD17110.1 hypothetical protein CV103_19110 [Sphingomonas fennica]
MDDFSRLGVIDMPTESSVLVSSSRYLNNPRLGDAMTTAMLRRNGRDRRVGWDSTNIVRAYWEVRDTGEINRLLAEERKRNAEFDAFMEERFISTFTREDLADYPKGTLGRIFHDYLVAGDLDIALDPRLRVDPDWRPATDLEYFELRSAQTHDFEHILGGVGFDAMAEVVPFWMRIENWNRNMSPELASEMVSLNMLLIMPMFTRVQLHYPAAYATLSDFVERGIQIGRVARPLFTAKYEPLFGLSLNEARAAMNIPPVEHYDSSEVSTYFGEGAPGTVKQPKAAA